MLCRVLSDWELNKDWHSACGAVNDGLGPSVMTPRICLPLLIIILPFLYIMRNYLLLIRACLASWYNLRHLTVSCHCLCTDLYHLLLFSIKIGTIDLVSDNSSRLSFIKGKASKHCLWMQPCSLNYSCASECVGSIDENWECSYLSSPVSVKLSFPARNPIRIIYFILF